MTDAEAAQQFQEWLDGGAQGDPPRVKIAARVTVQKFDGEGAFDPTAVPVETVVSEDPDFALALLKGAQHGTH